MENLYEYFYQHLADRIEYRILRKVLIYCIFNICIFNICKYKFFVTYTDEYI